MGRRPGGCCVRLTPPVVEGTAGDSGEHGASGGRWRPLLTAVLLITPFVVYGTWMALAHRPAFSQGVGYGPHDNAVVATDGMRDTAFVADGATGEPATILLTLRNDDSVDLTILGLADEALFAQDVAFAPGDGAEGQGVPEAARTDRLTLPAGELGTMWVTYAGRAMPGGSAGIDTIPLRVRKLGVLSTHDYRPDLPLRVYGGPLDGEPTPAWWTELQESGSSPRR